MIVVLLVGGCGNSNELEQPEEENRKLKATTHTRQHMATGDKRLGTYEYRSNSGILQFVLLVNGNAEQKSGTVRSSGRINWINTEELKWKITDGELHIIHKDTGAGVFRINKDGSITMIGGIPKDGKRIDIPKDKQFTLKRIK